MASSSSRVSTGAFLLLALTVSVSGFLSIPPNRLHHSPQQTLPRNNNHHHHSATTTTRTRVTFLDASANNHDQEPNDDDASSAVKSDRRRQLLLMSSLLSASNAALWSNNPAALAVETTTTSEQATISASNPFVDILRPPLDDQEYATYVMEENGLTVLLCSNPFSNDAAAAMDVHVGACSDPSTVPGLAHFNEHMLFLGTKPYPQEDSFESFLSSNGGSSNAYTDSCDTVYFFSMAAGPNDAKLQEGLDRFGSFFSAPLFTESAAGRELNAIESENSKNLQSDSFRTYQINKARSNPQHPLSKFFTGNKKTLLDDTRAQGIDLRQKLMEFYTRYYSANQMTLAVVAPQSIDTLQTMVQKAFSQIPNRQVSKPEDAWVRVVPPYSNDSLIPSFGHVVEIVPVQDLRQLCLSFPIVYQSDQDRINSDLHKQGEYVTHLVGHEGPGSLLSYLKKQNWANSLAAASMADRFPDFETFEIIVDLTSQGLAQVDRVTESIFSYVEMMRREGIPNHVFEEVLQLNELAWRFLTKSSAGNYATSLATAMQSYPPALYVAGPRRLALATGDEQGTLLESSQPRSRFDSPQQETFIKKLTYQLIDQLTVDNVMITVLSKSFAKTTDRKERWYGTDYAVRPIPPATMERWKNPVATSKLSVSFPKPNVFIPSESGLFVKIPPMAAQKVSSRTFESVMEPIAPPQVIRDDGKEGRWTVYFKADDRFGLPKAFVVFQLETKDVYSTPARAALSKLYQTCATDRLQEYAYDASLAGLSFDVQVLPRGVRLTFGGYNDKLQDFASYVAKKLAGDKKSILPQDDVEFERYKDNLMRAYSAFDVKQPYAHASYYAYLTMQPRAFQYTNEELRDALRRTTLPDLVNYVKTLWSSGKGQALIQGNLNKKEALALVNRIDKAIGFRTIAARDYPPRLQALPLPPVAEDSIPTLLMIPEPNPSDGNSAVHVLLQSVSRTPKDQVLIELMNAIVAEPFYEDLRTKQQLGYIVSSGVRALEETRTLAFVVQSSVKPSGTLAIAILEFLDKLHLRLEALNEGDVAVYAKAMIDRKTEPDKQLAFEVTRNWNEIITGRFRFDRVQREVKALLDIRKDDLVSFWDRLYRKDGRRVLVTQIIPRFGPASSPEPPKSTGYGTRRDQSINGTILGIDDIQQFRKDRETES